MSKMISQTGSSTTVAGAEATRNLDKLYAAGALLFGVFLIIGVGFAHADILHNAAHDGRHSFAFPCH